ncbi:MAG: DUF3656 domain-containing U32 family peptidase [Gemmataceae bacterium]
MNYLELLAPAGDWDALRAACANGANAVYFGLSAFNARARAANFTLDELPQVMEYLHARNVRGFVTMNILIFADELPEAARFVRAMAAAGVDAVIVQDLGLVQLIHALAPTMAIHASTQMTLTEPRGVRYARTLGVDRVVLARELSIADIQSITAEVDVPVEVFVHGALCVAYSGQCLTSEALGGRSANRGQCAQACRLPYELVVDGEIRDLGDRAYLLSPQDLAAYDHMGELIAAGVTSFKIEGRLKGGPYVAAATQTYRRAIDAAIAEQPPKFSRREELDLAQTFSRGFVPGFLEGVNHQRLVRGRFPKSRGIRLGRVVSVGTSEVVIEIQEAVPNLVQPGDGLLFDLGTPQEQEPGGRVWAVQSTTHRDRVIVRMEPDFEFRRVPVGCDVYKTDDPVLRKRLEQSYSREKIVHRRSLSATLRGEFGSGLTLTFQLDHRVAMATWPGPLERATKRATTAEEMRESLSRLGETPYELATFVCEVPGEALVPKSVLNDLRRQAVVQLQQSQSHAVATDDALARLRPTLPPPAEYPPGELSVLVRNLEQLEAVLAWVPAEDRPRLAMVLADFEDLRRYKDAVPLARAAGISIALATLRIWKPGEEGFQTNIVRAAPDAILVRNLAAIDYFRTHLPDVPQLGDYSLNVANDLTARLLLQQGLTRLVPSFDLNWPQFAALIANADPAFFEAVVHQHMPMFHMEHCVFAATLSTGKDFRDCGRPCETHKVELRDRVGAHFALLPDTGCRNTVFNSVPQSGAEYIPAMRARGIRRFRVDLLRETPEQIPTLLDAYARVIAGADDGRATWTQLKALNQLGVTRGTLNLL